MDEKNSFEEIKVKLVCKRENVWCQNNDSDVTKFSEDYKLALSNGKTERELAKFSKNYLLNKGFKEFTYLLKLVAFYCMHGYEGFGITQET